MQYKITPGLEELFVEAKAKAKKEKKEKDELVVESAEEVLPAVGTLNTKEDVIKMLDTDINAAAEAYNKLESDDDKAAVRAAIAQKAAIEKQFDDAVKRQLDAQQAVHEENQEKQEITEPVGETIPDGDSNLGNNDQDYAPANLAPSVGGDLGEDALDPLTAGIKEQLVVEAEYHIRHGLDKKAYLKSVDAIYSNDQITKEASTIFDNAVSAKQPSNLMKTAEKMDMLLQAAAAYKEQKPDYEGYLKTAAESTSGEEWLRKLAGINIKADDSNDEQISDSVANLLKQKIDELQTLYKKFLPQYESFVKDPQKNDLVRIYSIIAFLDTDVKRLLTALPKTSSFSSILEQLHAELLKMGNVLNEIAGVFNKQSSSSTNNTPSSNNIPGNKNSFTGHAARTSLLKTVAVDVNYLLSTLQECVTNVGNLLDSLTADTSTVSATSSKYNKGITKTAAKLDEAPANNKEHPGQKMFNNGKSTQENGNTPEDFPGNKLFDKTNTAVETVFPEGQVTQDQIIKDRTIIKDLSKIKDVNDQTIAVMQPIVVEPVNLGDSAENNMKDFFFNGNNITRSPEPSKTLPAGKPAHEVDDVIVSMDELSKKAK